MTKRPVELISPAKVGLEKEITDWHLGAKKNL